MSGDGEKSMVGRVNVYLCDTCRFATVTVHKDHGVTPFIIGCKHDGCGQRSYSMLYRAPTKLSPTHEWYVPDVEETARLHPAIREHVAKGGLLLRPIAPAVAAAASDRLTKAVTNKQMVDAAKESRTAAELCAEWEKLKRDKIKSDQNKLAEAQKQPLVHDARKFPSVLDELLKEANELLKEPKQ